LQQQQQQHFRISRCEAGRNPVARASKDYKGTGAGVRFAGPETIRARSQVMRDIAIAIGVIVLVAWCGAAAFTSQGGSCHGQDSKAGEKQPKDTDEAKVQLPLCPVMGDDVDFNVKTMTAEGPVFFCCPMCIGKFEKEPEKYAEKLAAQREALKKMERIQVNCPVSGDPIDGRTPATVEGRTVHFCSKECVAKYEKEPGKYKAKLEASYTYQTRCPVSAEKIAPTAYADLPTGERVYLCCPGCRAPLQKEPGKFATKLAAQGVHLDLRKLTRDPKDEERKGDVHSGHRHGHGE
jgi:YHS domain-containing protein